jgi:hypothetical protein
VLSAKLPTKKPAQPPTTADDIEPTINPATLAPVQFNSTPQPIAAAATAPNTPNTRFNQLNRAC